MFLKSIIEGLIILSRWQIWAAVVFFVIIKICFSFITEKLFDLDKSDKNLVFGCLFHNILGTILEGVTLGFLIAYLIPVLLGGKEGTPLIIIINMIWPIIKVSIISIILVLAISFIPIIGQFISVLPGFQIFLQGIIIFRFLSNQAINNILKEANVYGNLYPGFWSTIGFLIIGVIVSLIFMSFLTLISTRILDEEKSELVTVLLGYIFGVLSGLISLSMYCTYVSLSILQIIGGR